MPKQKTHSGIKKRVRVTGSGKIVHAGSAKRHHLERQPTRQTRRADGMHVLSNADVPRVKRMLGI
ncbi:50S ribosomal protein L35 [Nakamurella sp. A5-74]|uniref:Large ribosomal subunit protein bL35 n=1 Tax=Nakamurella sp. A5-74 TaxID=3158264 RepID=A0AAU8DM16_9ACTN